MNVQPAVRHQKARRMTPTRRKRFILIFYLPLSLCHESTRRGYVRDSRRNSLKIGPSTLFLSEKYLFDSETPSFPTPFHRLLQVNFRRSPGQSAAIWWFWPGRLESA